MIARVTGASGCIGSAIVERLGRDGFDVRPVYREQTAHYCNALVNCAGMAQRKTWSSIDTEDWNRMMHANLLGAWRCCQSVLPFMLDNGYGRIINIASIGGERGGTEQIHYAASKAGLIGLTKSVARIGAPHGVTCNAVSPGLIAGGMTDPLTDGSQVPMGRLGEPEEVAAAVAFLASEDAGYITGQVLRVNGGML